MSPMGTNNLLYNLRAGVDFRKCVLGDFTTYRRMHCKHLCRIKDVVEMASC